MLQAQGEGHKVQSPLISVIWRSGVNVGEKSVNMERFFVGSWEEHSQAMHTDPTKKTHKKGVRLIEY